MSKKSLQEVWVKLANQRREDAQRQSITERAIQEDRERARLAYLQKNKMYELAFNPSAAAAASSSAGAGGGGGRLRRP